MTQTQTKKATYHHGNLKAALMDAGFQLLETGSLDQLSLRALAKTVGVTPTAAYNHFKDKTALMVDMKAEAFRRLDRMLRDTLASTATDEQQLGDPQWRIRTLARAYINFAFEQPGLFNLLFGWNPTPDHMTEDLIESAACGETLLRETVTLLFQQEGIELTPYQQAVATLSSWSLAHGITSLLQGGEVDAATVCGHWPEQFASDRPEEQTRVLEHLFTIQLAGLKATLTDMTP